VVKPGERVRRGRLVAVADGFISTTLHASVTGTVAAIERRPHPGGGLAEAVVIRTDPYSSQRLEQIPPPPPETLTPQEFATRVQGAGIVGLGGAAFPSHVKLQVPEGKRIRFVILNGCECEPYLTCDHRIMVERTDAVLHGMRLILRQVGAERGYVGIERNKADAIEAMRRSVLGHRDIQVVPLRVKYPQGAEKNLIDAVLRREVPSGKLPIDIEILVHNVGTAAAIADLFQTGQPLIERVVTVTGDGVQRPANVIVPLGTPLSAILDHCGGLKPKARHVILGGPMMGLAQKRLDVPLVKGASGILALCQDIPVEEEQPCIRCGRCLEACPAFLNPARLALLVRNELIWDLRAQNVLDCVECASCSYTCPSRIPLVQLIRMGKALVRQQKVS
jgi:electron transport complex protein RnfC